MLQMKILIPSLLIRREQKFKVQPLYFFVVTLRPNASLKTGGKGKVFQPSFFFFPSFFHVRNAADT